MTDKDKLHHILSSLWKNDDSVGKTYYNQALQDVQIAIDSLQEEPVSVDLEEAASRYAKEEYSHKSPETLPDRCVGCYAPLMYAFKAGAQWQRDQILNCNATLLRTFELGKIEMKHQILKAMDLGEPPYLISVEKAYYDVKKLLEG